MLHTISPGMGFAYLALLVITIISNYVILPINVSMITMSSCIIYIGAHLSIHVKERRGEEGSTEEEAMTQKDAYMFPILGSAMLFGLYVLFKFFDKDLVNLLLSCYFTLIGVYTLFASFSPFLAQFFPKNSKTYNLKFNVPFNGPVHLSFTFSDIVSLLISIGFAGAWFKTKHFLLNNLFGISFSIKGIETLALGSYKVGAILLTGLFFYDIFWVFGTEVMVTVAKSFDAPIKLLFPRAFATATEKAQFSLLGLGDIVIPGIFIALLLRFDAFRAGVKTIDGTLSYKFKKPYFTANLISYIGGLVTTVIVMIVYEHAQPALLYLVPACLGASLLQAIVRREFGQLWNYSEEEEGAEKKEVATTEDKKVEAQAQPAKKETKKIK